MICEYIQVVKEKYLSAQNGLSSFVGRYLTLIRHVTKFNNIQTNEHWAKKAWDEGKPRGLED